MVGCFNPFAVTIHVDERSTVTGIVFIGLDTYSLAVTTRHNYIGWYSLSFGFQIQQAFWLTKLMHIHRQTAMAKARREVENQDSTAIIGLPTVRNMKAHLATSVDLK